jgi:hypothetical protein
LANPKDEISVSEMPKAEMAAAQMGVHLIPFVASAPAELRALEPSALSHSDGLYVLPTPLVLRFHPILSLPPTR